MEKKTNKIRIDDLAAMMQRGFRETASKRDFETLETNLAQMIAELPTRTELKQLLELDKRVGALELEMQKVREKLPTIEV